MPIDLIDAYKIQDINGSPNFAKVLKENFDEMAVKYLWNEETQAQYKQIYNRYVLFYVNLKKALEDFDNDDYRDYCDKIYKNASYLAEETLNRIIRLFCDVYEYGVKKGWYEDNLFLEARREFPNQNTAEKKAKAQNIVKSLTVRNLVKIANWASALQPKTCNNLDIGFIIMLLTGARVNEVCGITYGNVLLKNDPGRSLGSNLENDFKKNQFPVIAIVRSTKLRSSEHKIGGKTSNADRLIPICWFLYNFIVDRKEKFKALESSGRSLNDTPIVSDDDGNGVTTRQLSEHIRNVFKNLQICSDEQRFSLVLDLDLQKRILKKDSYINEEYPTAYMLRRNYATMYASLGLTESELQYVFGHEVESDKRESYLNEDKLAQIYRKICRHPLCMLLDKEDLMFDRNVISINLNGEKAIRIEASEPFEKIKYKYDNLFKKSKPRFHFGTVLEDCSGDVDILEDLLVLYRNELSAIESEEV